MLSNSGLSKAFWAEAVTYACFLINRLPSSALKEKHLRKSGMVSLLMIMIWFMYLVVLLGMKDNKLVVRAVESIFVGMKNRVKGFKL